jgi:hypothetical protein
MPRSKPTPVPKTPALVRGSVLAIAVGVGLGGGACGGLATSSGGPPPQPDGGGDASEGGAGVDAGDGVDGGAVAEGGLDAVAFLPAHDAEAQDAKPDTVILVPPHPPPVPHP